MDEEFFGPPQSKISPRVWIITGLALVIVLMAGYFGWQSLQKNKAKADAAATIVNTPQANNVSDWKAYSNSKYGYSIKYINSWFVNDKDETKLTIQPDQPLTNEQIQSQGADAGYLKGLTIEITDGKAAQPVEDIVKTVYPDANYYSESVVIDGLPGLRVVPGCQTLHCATEERFIVRDGRLYHIKQNQDLAKDTFNQMLASFKFIVASQPATTNLTDFKTYTNNDLKIEFKYPAIWQNIELYPVEKDALTKGTAFTSLYKEGDTQPTYFDKDDLYSFNIYSKDFDNNIITSPGPAKISLDWTLDDFVKNMKPQDWIMGYQRLGNNAVLVISHSDRECFPNYQINVFVPTNNPNFPDFIINVNSSKIDQDQTIIDYLHFQGAGGKSVCDTTLPYQEITDKILTGTYSVDMKAQLQTVQAIADSFKNL